MDNKLLLPEDKLAQFNRGESKYLYRYLGAHIMELNGAKGVRFAVWAPMVKSVQVIGDFNDWREDGWWLEPQASSGVWAGFFTDIPEGALYKYLITTQDGEKLYKADPCGFSAEVRPGTASRVVEMRGYRWRDAAWMKRRAKQNHFKQPMNIYEVHLGSWKQHPAQRASEQDVPIDAFYTYRETADELIPYVKDMGYTHIELMPVMEHPFDGSWGYQVTGFYAATSRYGSPKDLMYLVDTAHRAGIGVILDWVPGHFCRDAHGLGRFNGGKLYEDMDHAHWGTYTFDYGRKEVRSFLLSNAVFWLTAYHADGLRVDGVSSMLYLNYGMDDSPHKRFNKYGGEGNLEAISFLQEFNHDVGTLFPGVFTIAEESSAWPKITRPPQEDGLGFHYKWDMGWMNDTLSYFQTDYPWRPGGHNKLTFSMMYAFSENFILPLSHDEVVHGKASLIGRQPGGDDMWRRFAGLRLLAMYQLTHSGGKHNFMGNEFGQFIEWRFYEGLEWFLLDVDHHRQHQDFIRALNHMFLQQTSMWQRNFNWDGFQWIDPDNREQGVLIFYRQGDAPNDQTIVALNFQPMSYGRFRLGVPKSGVYKEIFNSDDPAYGGGGCTNPDPVKAEKKMCHNRPWSVSIKLPPLGGVVLRRTAAPRKAEDEKPAKKSGGRKK